MSLRSWIKNTVALRCPIWDSTVRYRICIDILLLLPPSGNGDCYGHISPLFISCPYNSVLTEHNRMNLTTLKSEDGGWRPLPRRSQKVWEINTKHFWYVITVIRTNASTFEVEIEEGRMRRKCLVSPLTDLKEYIYGGNKNEMSVQSCTNAAQWDEHAMYFWPPNRKKVYSIPPPLPIMHHRECRLYKQESSMQSYTSTYWNNTKNKSMLNAQTAKGKGRVSSKQS